MAGLLEIPTVLTLSVSVFSGRRGARIFCDAASQLSLDSAYKGVTNWSFGRLKVQRIRDFVKESHRKNKPDNALEGDQQKAERSPSRVPRVISEESNLLDE